MNRQPIFMRISALTTRAALITAFALAAFTRPAPAAFTPLIPVPPPRVIHSSTAYPGEAYTVDHLFDGNPKTEYSSASAGTNTFVEIEFPQTVRLRAIRHLDRNDPATVAASELLFLDSDGRVTGTATIPHVNRRGGDTFFVLPSAIPAQRVKWRVAKLGPQGYGTVGGAELSFFAERSPEPAPREDRMEIQAIPFLERNGQAGLQPIQITVGHFYAEPADAELHLGNEVKPLHLQPGPNRVEWKVPGVTSSTRIPVDLVVASSTVSATNVTQTPVRPLTVYILPHSHTDIGYTEIQTAIEKKQVQNLVDGIAAARRTAAYPEGARFVWNVEVLWAADLYLHRLGDEQRASFLDAVRKGQVALNGMYLNELTGLCRPEELLHLFRFATQLEQKTGVPIDAAMISDVPGYTWGTVTAMAQAGIKYFSTAPNYFDRIGTILREWENKPFYWLGPDGRTKVLVWIPFWGYAMSHRYGKMSPQLVEDFYHGLEQRKYPYDIAYVRWSGHGDNAVPDPAICEFVKDWNQKYVWPRFVISGTSQAFRALEKRYGAELPVVRGDWTPYWEDGAGSSARETSMNRQSADRLSQAETLFAMSRPSAYPANAFQEAWKNVLLYSEHTWGAWCSVSEPERQETKEQWAIKKSYADQADQQSRELLASVLDNSPAPIAASIPGGGPKNTFTVINTLSWPRKGLVTVPPACAGAGDRVTDDEGRPVPSQRLASGELVFLANNIPPFSTRFYDVSPGQPFVEGHAVAQGATLENGTVRLRLDKETGGIIELTAKGIDGNFADTTGGEALNDYLYLPGDDLKDLKRNGRVKISVGEPGPLVASLIVDSAAPGCKSLHREVRLIAGMDAVEIINHVDKARLQAKSYHAKEGKESVNFAFPFNVPGGQMLLDVPLGLVRPDVDQMPSACKNWFTIGRWADVSNREKGIAWVTIDAPLVEIGGITANLLNSQTNPDIWRKKVGRTQKLYSWAMNNHWGTNYRAYQDGPTVFRFFLRPHRELDPPKNSRFAIGCSQPLLARSAETGAPTHPLLQVAPDNVLVLGLKPSDDGQALIIRLFEAAGQPASATLQWGDHQPKTVFISDTSERPGKTIEGPVDLPGNGLVTLRAQF